MENRKYEIVISKANGCSILKPKNVQLALKYFLLCISDESITFVKKNLCKIMKRECNLKRKIHINIINVKDSSDLIFFC